MSHNLYVMLKCNYYNDVWQDMQTFEHVKVVKQWSGKTDALEDLVYNV